MSILMGTIVNTAIVIICVNESFAAIHYSIMVETIVFSIILYYGIGLRLTVREIGPLSILQSNPAVFRFNRCCSAVLIGMIHNACFIIDIVLVYQYFPIVKEVISSTSNIMQPLRRCLSSFSIVILTSFFVLIPVIDN